MEFITIRCGRKAAYTRMTGLTIPEILSNEQEIILRKKQKSLSHLSAVKIVLKNGLQTIFKTQQQQIKAGILKQH